MSWLRSPSLTLATLFLAVASFQACRQTDPQNTPVDTLNILPNPSAINSHGASTTLTITATNADGTAGTGTVDLSAAAGQLSPATITLSGGGATATYTCDDAVSAGCSGQIRIIGRWGNVTSGAFVTVGDAPPPTGDAGSDAGSDPDAGTNAGTPVSIGWSSSKCGGQDCSLLGISGSGFNEQAQVSFLVEDANNVPVPNVTVAFTLVDAPAGTSLESASAPTNSVGVVVARVVSGPVIGAFTVRATVAVPALSAVSPTLGVRGAKPTNRGFTFQCEKINIDAWTTAQPPKLINLNCNVGLTDRFNNPVGTGTSVFFKTEAGNITNNVATIAFDPDGTNNTEGTATVQWRTGPGGSFPPLDVPPLSPDSNQWPYPRLFEPSVSNSPPFGVPPVTRNPRDQLVTVLAYVQGEEHFWDDDSDGVHDSTERFIDQGEPFVDSNDDNVWNTGETFIDANANNVWDGPNGQWDANTTIWVERRLLLTGYMDPSMSSVSGAFSGGCGGGLPKEASTTFSASLVDPWLNFVTSGSTVAVSHSASKGGVRIFGGGAQLDTYGFGYDRLLVDDSTELECNEVSTICRWKNVFYGWDRPFTVLVTGAPATDVTPCANDVVTVGVTVQGVLGEVYSPGAIE